LQVGFIRLQDETVKLIRENEMKKGDVLDGGRDCRYTGSQKTSDLIPLCHPLQITKADVKATLEKNGVSVKATLKCIGQTGIEMEALLR
jgi:cyclic pyranopterin monophosphate synthase